mmetsp:Transcript_2027/g.6121  ORF Transcript_2027/g.6121 Transcript_2027/m.6121 type:complete len:493 (-) Transcript_2027:589-2067(-)
MENLDVRGLDVGLLQEVHGRRELLPPGQDDVRGDGGAVHGLEAHGLQTQVGEAPRRRRGGVCADLAQGHEATKEGKVSGEQPPQAFFGLLVAEHVRRQLDLLVHIAALVASDLHQHPTVRPTEPQRDHALDAVDVAIRVEGQRAGTGHQLLLQPLKGVAHQRPECVPLPEGAEGREAHVQTRLVLHANDQRRMLHAWVDVVQLFVVQHGNLLLVNLGVVAHDVLNLRPLHKHLVDGIARELQQLAIDESGRGAQERPGYPNGHLRDPRTGSHDTEVGVLHAVAPGEVGLDVLPHLHPLLGQLRVAEATLGHDESPVCLRLWVEKLTSMLHVDGVERGGAEGLDDPVVQAVPGAEDRVAEHVLRVHVLAQLRAQGGRQHVQRLDLLLAQSWVLVDPRQHVMVDAIREARGYGVLPEEPSQTCHRRHLLPLSDLHLHQPRGQDRDEDGREDETHYEARHSEGPLEGVRRVDRQGAEHRVGHREVQASGVLEKRL